MVYYDTMLTFADEVELIWKQKFSLMTVLWFLVEYSTQIQDICTDFCPLKNRYLSPLGYVIITVCKYTNFFPQE